MLADKQLLEIEGRCSGHTKQFTRAKRRRLATVYPRSTSTYTSVNPLQQLAAAGMNQIVVLPLIENALLTDVLALYLSDSVG